MPLMMLQTTNTGVSGSWIQVAWMRMCYVDYWAAVAVLASVLNFHSLLLLMVQQLPVYDWQKVEYSFVQY